MVAFIPIIAGGLALILLTWKDYRKGRKKT